MKQEKKMKVKSKFITFLKILVAVVAIFGIATAGILINDKVQSHKNQLDTLRITESHKTDLQIVEETIENASRLETADYVCTIVEDSYSCKKMFGKDIKFTETGYIVSYKGTVSAGIDLSKATVKQLDKNTIEILLPQIEVYEPNFDNASMKKYDEKNSVFNPLTIDDVNETEINAKNKIKEEAINYGIEEKAKANAEEMVLSLMSQVLNNSEIKIVWQ